MQVQFNETSDPTIVESGGSDSKERRRETSAEPINFGRFCAIPGSRQLLMDGRPREIGGRAFDLLMVLLNSNGGIVSKDEILDVVWPSMVVGECNLRFQIASLRRALGDNGNMVKTIVRRGYMLVRAKALTERQMPDMISPQPRCPDFTSPRPSSRAVVLIEDDEGVRNAISGLLRSVGLVVAPFGSVREYRDSDLFNRPACIILDVCLPDRSGLDFQADLGEKGQWYPIIFISGHADVPMCARAMKAGALEFLTKPVRYLDLLSAVQAGIARLQFGRTDSQEIA